MRWSPASPPVDYLVVNNKTITFHSGGGNTGSIATNDLSIDISTGTVATLTAAIDTRDRRHRAPRPAAST